MRILNTALTLVLAMSLGAAARAADNVKAVVAKGQIAVLVEKFQDLHLTDAQEAKIAEIRKECRPKVQEATREMTALVKEQIEKVRDVLTAEQKQKLQDLKEEREERREDCLAHAIASLKELDLTDAEMTRIGEIRKEYRPRIQKAMKELEDLLTETQKKLRETALKEDRKRGELLESLKLTEGQKNRMATLAKDVGALVKEEVEKIREVITEEQKQKLQTLKEERRERIRDRMAHRIASLRDFNLTDEQKTRIEKIREEFRPKVHEAGNKLRAAVTEEMERILAVLKG
jgi:Spy/CpxP family protein refolding chaperone